MSGAAGYVQRGNGWFFVASHRQQLENVLTADDCWRLLSLEKTPIIDLCITDGAQV